MANLVVPPSMVRQKAQQIAYSLNISSDDFLGSNGWYYRFAKRINLHAINSHGEGGEVHRNNPLLLEKLSALEHLIESYDTNNVYNMDETGLFFRLMPQYTVMMPNEDASTVRGMKIQKGRVTLSVCANATGIHKLPLQMIVKAKRPACIIGHQWPLPYCNQKKAWMDTTIFMKWFDEIFYQEVRRRTRRPVFLLLDNAPGHSKEFTRKNITLKFFLPM
jgi:hypothetical protein